MVRVRGKWKGMKKKEERRNAEYPLVIIIIAARCSLLCENWLMWIKTQTRYTIDVYRIDEVSL